MPAEVVAQVLVVPDAAEGAVDGFDVVHQFFVHLPRFPGLHVVVAFQGAFHQGEGVYGEGHLAVALEVVERELHADACAEAGFLGVAHRIVVAYARVQERAVGLGQLQPQEVRAVADDVAVGDVGQTLRLRLHEVGVVERGVGGVQAYLGIVAQVFDELAELVVVVGDVLVEHAVVGQQHEEHHRVAGVALLLVEDVVERVVGIVFPAGDDAPAAAHLGGVAAQEQVAYEARHRAEGALVLVAVGGVDVDGGQQVVAVPLEVCVGEAFVDFPFNHPRPLVHHGRAQEPLLVGDALACHEAALHVGVVGQVFLVARHHVERGRQEVERKVQVASVHGEKGVDAVADKGVRLLLFDDGLEQQVARLDPHRPVAHPLGAVAQHGVVALRKGLGVGRDFEIGPQHVTEHHVERVSESVGQFGYVYQHKSAAKVRIFF